MLCTVTGSTYKYYTFLLFTHCPVRRRAAAEYSGVHRVSRLAELLHLPMHPAVDMTNLFCITSRHLYISICVCCFGYHIDFVYTDSWSSHTHIYSIIRFFSSRDSRQTGKVDSYMYMLILPMRLGLNLIIVTMDFFIFYLHSLCFVRDHARKSFILIMTWNLLIHQLWLSYQFCLRIYEAPIVQLLKFSCPLFITCQID